MNSDRSREALAKFLDYVAEKGLMPTETAKARKIAAGKVFGILTPEESSDVFKIDIHQTMLRFNNLHGSKYTPGSLSTYQSRIVKALEDFDAYIKNPLGFRRTGQARERTAKQTPQVSPDKANLQTDPLQPQGGNNNRQESPGIDVPIPIRADLTVYVRGLPFNLSRNEASKIAAVVMALSGD